jgi:hypothetical protein
VLAAALKVKRRNTTRLLDEIRGGGTVGVITVLAVELEPRMRPEEMSLTNETITKDIECGQETQLPRS